MPRPSMQISYIFYPEALNHVLQPATEKLSKLPKLKARGNRPLQMTFEDQFKILVYFHLQEYKSGRHLLQELEEDEFVRNTIAPKKRDKKKQFF